MNIWKLGCNWGSGKPYFHDFLRNEKVVLCWGHNFKVGDIVIIAKGFRIIALAKITGSKKQLIANNDFKYIYEKYRIEENNGIYYCGVDWFDLDIVDYFDYQQRKGICQVENHETLTKINHLIAKYITKIDIDKINIAMNEKVVLKTKTLEQVFEMHIVIPDYQRIYCWTEKNVLKLLDDIVECENKTYHLGSIILHKTTRKVIINDESTEDVEEVYSIVDGQQRLVTLTLLLLMLGNVASPLLNETFASKEAQDYIAYNKTLINNYLLKYLDKIKTENILQKLQFSVLIINDGSLDLAYTFFSNQNSRGKSLTDYDLLKAHHLRFIHIEKQAIHLAERWDNVVLNSSNDAIDKELGRTFGIYLFRLRKWMRKKLWSEDQKFKVKEEFEAMDIIPDIPPFGEKFHFYESIQGGSHFFAYADYYIFKFRVFTQTNEYISLKSLDGETHWWYRDVIETLLFAYFLKFDTIYLSEALYCIEQLISSHRYGLGRSSLRAVLEHGGNSEITMMIDQATSPTFFLAECLNKIQKQAPLSAELKPIQSRYKSNISTIQGTIRKNMCVATFIELINP